MSLATWFTPKVKTKSRGKGQSSVAAAAYRAGMKLEDARTGEAFNYSKKPVISNHIIGWKKDCNADNKTINELWNQVEKAEKKRNAIVCHEEIVPMCFDWTQEQRHSCAMEIAEELNRLTGAPVQASAHPADIGKRNTHYHFLFPTRKFDPESEVWGKKIDLFSKKWDCWKDQKDMRKLIAEITNKHAMLNGDDWFVTGGKFKEFLGEDYIPSRRLGSIQNKGQAVYTDNEEYNQELAVYRSHVEERRRLDEEIKHALERIAKAHKEEKGKTEAQLESSASDRKNRMEADAQTINANEHRIKEVALYVDNLLQARDDLVASLARTNEKQATYEANKKNFIRSFGQEEYDEGIDDFNEDIADEKEKLKIIKQKLKDPVGRVLFIEYKRRLESAMTPLDKAHQKELKTLKSLDETNARISKGEALGLWEPDAQITCEQKRIELIQSLNEAQREIWDLTPEEERDTVMEPAPPRPYTNAELDQMPSKPFENYAEMRVRIEEERIERNRMVAERGSFIKEEWHI